MIDITASKLWLINFYREQLSKFKSVGMGNNTEFDVIVTPRLIKATEKRLNQLTIVYDMNITPQGHTLRRLKLERLEKEGQINVKFDSNEAATTESCEDIRTNGYERSKS